jgi:hypothetical protein
MATQRTMIKWNGASIVGGQKGAVMKIATIALLSIIGFWLLNDAMTFALYAADPLSGRAYGCYTTIENLLGVKQPSAVRRAQSLMGVALAFGVPLAAGVQAAIRRRHRRSI